MAHHRAKYPASIIPDFHAMGLERAAKQYQTHPQTLRRFLVESGVAIRPQGHRIRRAP